MAGKIGKGRFYAALERTKHPSITTHSKNRPPPGTPAFAFHTCVRWPAMSVKVGC